MRIGVESQYLMRVVFHLDVDSDGTRMALGALEDALAEALPGRQGQQQ